MLVLEVLLAVRVSEGGFLVALYESDDSDEGYRRVDHEPPTAEEQSLAEDHREHREVHGIAHESINPGHDERLGWRNWRGRSPVEGEQGEGVKQESYP